MSKQQILYFGEIDLQQTKDEYISALMYDGRKIKLDLNLFENEQTAPETIQKAHSFLEKIEEHIRNVYKSLNDDYEAEGETYGYIEHHMEELEPEELAKIIENYQPAIPQDDELFDKLQLQRIGLYPEDDGEFAVFDFSIGDKYTDYLIAIFVNINGEVVDLGIES